MVSLLWSCLIAALLISVDAISVLSIKGTKFYDATGKQFFIKGVAYQRSPLDPLVNDTQCQLDAALMQTLGVNAIRTYHVDPTGNHDGCMQAFSEAGIYLFLDVDTFDTMINQTSPSWPASSYTAFTKVIDAFDKYDNMAGFFVSNEGVNTPDGLAAAPYIKAAVRDTKAYMKAKGGRYIPMGYSAADIASIRPMFQNYLVCGDTSATIDFFAVNIYEWCGDSTYQASGYADRTAEFQGYPVPAFFSETGCNVVLPRTFGDMVAIYGPNMTGVLSGAIVYEWTQEVNNYGLITYPGSAIQNNIPVPAGSPIPIQPDFDNLWSQWAAASPVGTSAAAYTPQVVTVTCPAMVSGWTIDGNAALPPAPTSLSPPAASTYVPTTHAPYPTAVTTASVLAGSSGVSVPGQNSEAQTSASGAGGSVAGTSGGSGNSATAAASGGSSTAASAGTKNSMSYLFGLMGLVSTCIGLSCIVFR